MQLSDKIYGKMFDGDTTTAQSLINHKKPSELERINKMKAEMNYVVNKREPLGRVPDRGHILPTKFTEGKEPFGEKSQSSNEPAKGLLFPNELLDDGRADEIYKRSHGSYGVGEQIKRGYNWNVDPTTNRFGIKGDTIALNGVSTNITEVLQGDLRNNTDSIVNMKEVEEFRNMKDVLGQSKNLGQGSAMRSNEMVYGKVGKNKGIGAGEVIRGRYTDDQTQPDVDLGKSITPGFRNISMDDRAYGCPSIRSDIPCLPVQRRSLADSQNYGDDVPAQDLINPPMFSDLAIDPMIMQSNKTKEELKMLFARIGYEFDAQTSDAIFAAAAQGQRTTTINAYRNQLNLFILEQELY